MLDDPLHAALSYGQTARQALRNAQERLGNGDVGRSAMSDWADRARLLAIDEDDRECEALSYFYSLSPQVLALPAREFDRRFSEAHQRCQALAVPRASWLLDDLRMWVLAVRGQHQHALAIGKQLERVPSKDRPDLERSISQFNLFRVCALGGHLETALRHSYRAVELAKSDGPPSWVAATLTGLGGLVTQTALDPEGGLIHLRAARQILLQGQVAPTFLINTSQIIMALAMLGHHQQAHDLFVADLARPGSLDMLRPGAIESVASVRARLAQALIGVGKLDEAEQWLDALPPQAYNSLISRHNIGNLMRLQILCARGRFAQARDLAICELDSQLLHTRMSHDQFVLLDCLREACEAEGDRPGAQAAVATAREACVPLLKLSARARYLTICIERDPLHAPQLTSMDLRRLEVIDQQFEAQLADADVSAEAAQVPRILEDVVTELRAPIGGMVAITAQLGASRLDERQRRLTSAMMTSAKTLMLLVNDILDLARLERGRFSIELSSFELRPWLRELIEPFLAQAEMQGIVLTADVDDSVPATFEGDALRLSQVLSNLVSNALKFAAQGWVVVRVACIRLWPGRRTAVLRFEVRDSGKGIPAEAMTRLFQEFSQSDAVTARNHGGTGLGLALCKQLVERMGGSIGASSLVGEGSVFWFQLPLLDTASQS